MIPSPYKGLAPFEDTELDALLFFGREREIGIISANVLASRLTVLYGPSGVGKSSLLRAGVAHRLRAHARENVEERGHPEYVVVVYDQWSDDPVAALRHAVREALAEQFGSALLEEVEGEPLADTFGRWTEALACDLLLVLDQAEEYFLYHPEETGFARELPELVTRPRLRVRVLLALRDDALAKLDRFKGRIPNLFSNYLRLDHLDRASAREAVVRPVELYNEASGESVEVEPLLIDDVLDQTAAGKVDLGEAGRGLAAGESDQGRIEAPYLQLVLERVWDEERGAGSDVLRAQTLAALGGAESIVRTNLHRAVEELTQQEQDVAADIFRFLVTPSGTKIAHGAGDLAEYASVDEREVVPVLATLGRERIVRPVDGASRNGARYEIFHDVLGDAVLAWRRERERDRERRAAARRQRRLVAIAMVALLALAAMTAVAIYAFSQRSEARQQGRDAEARALVAESLNQLSVDPEESLMLGLQAARIEHSRQVEDVLRQALEASRLRKVFRPRLRIFRLYRRNPNAWLETFDVTSDLRLIAVARGNTVRIESNYTGRLIRVLKGHVGRVIAVDFSRNGKLLATGSEDGTGGIWRVADGFHVATLVGHTGFVTWVEFNRRGDLVATGSRDRTARIWDTKAGKPFLVLRGHKDAVMQVHWSGGRLSTLSNDGTIRIWDAEPEPRMHAIGRGRPRPAPRVAEIAGMRATAQGNVVVVRKPDGSQIRLIGHTKPVTSVHFDQAGERLVTTSLDGDARIWDAETGAKLQLLRGHFAAVSDAGFSPDGRWVVTAGPFSAGLWRSDRDTIQTFIRNTDRPMRARFADNHRIVTVARNGKVRDWNCEICGTLDELGVLAEKRLAQTGRTP